MDLLQMFAGILALVAGQQLFWAFVALLGFITGVHASTIWALGLTEWQTLLIGLACGIAGAAMAFFFQGLAILIAGFLAGGYIFDTLWTTFGLLTDQLWMILLVCSGVAGSVLLVMFLEPVLILLSSMVGASLIVGILDLTPFFKMLTFTGLVVAGAVIQSWSLALRD